MASVPQGKRCTKCDEVQPESEFYVKDRKKGRLFSWCKTCHCRKTRQNYADNIDYGREYRREAAKRRWRESPEHRERCREWRDENRGRVNEAARKRGATPEVKAKKAAYRAANAERRRAYNAAYVEANAEKVRQRQKEYRERLGEELLRRHKAWRDANPERLREISQRAKKKRYPKAKIEAHYRRTLGRLEGALTPEEWEAIKAAADYRCLRCGRPEPEIKLTMDHVIPVAAGGQTTADNVQPLCRPCNCSKHRRHTDYRKPR